MASFGVLPADQREGIPEQFSPGFVDMALARMMSIDQLLDEIDGKRSDEAFNGAFAPPAPRGQQGVIVPSPNPAELNEKIIAGVDTASPLGARLVGSESGGSFTAQNDVPGSGGVGHYGRGQFSIGRMDDAKRAGVIPAEMSPQMFMADPAAQRAVEAWHRQDIEGDIRARGLDRYVGQQIKGIPVTPQGMVNVAHLGGKEGMARFLESGGAYDPADANGTKLSDYLAMGARESEGAPDPRVASLMQVAGSLTDPVQQQLIGQLIESMKPAAPQSPEGKLYADERSGLVPPGTFGQPAGASEEAIARLMEAGLDRNTAVGIVDGRLAVSRDPVTGAAQVVDKATGQVLGGEAPSQRPPPAPASTSTMPDNVDYRGATGTEGFVSGLANTVAEIAGMGLIAPQNERAMQALANLHTRTQVELAGAVAGRPSNYLLEQFERLAVTPGSPFQGPGRSRERLTQTRDTLDEAIRMNVDVARENVTPQMQAEANANITRLKRLRDDYSTVLESFGDRGASTGGDIDALVNRWAQ